MGDFFSGLLVGSALSDGSGDGCGCGCGCWTFLLLGACIFAAIMTIITNRYFLGIFILLIILLAIVGIVWGLIKLFIVIKKHKSKDKEGK